MSEKKILFNFKETEPDVSNFSSRLVHFLEVTNPKWFMKDDTTI